MTSPSDMELYDLALNGDASALERLIRRHYNVVYRLAYKWCGVQQDAEDISQEVFIKLVRKLHTFNRKSSFKTWLCRITINTAKDVTRKNAAKKQKESAFALECEAGNPHPDTTAAVETRGALAAVHKLPEKQKSAVLLVFGEGLTHKEAADALNCSETTISWRIFMARKRLKKICKSE